MRKHRTVQILGIVIIAAALVYLVLGVIGAISLGGSGLGEGWSSGWRGWLTIPILLTTFLGFVALLVFGALLYFLAKIDTNLAEAQQRLAVRRRETRGCRRAGSRCGRRCSSRIGRTRRRGSRAGSCSSPWPQQPSRAGVVGSRTSRGGGRGRGRRTGGRGARG